MNNTPKYVAGQIVACLVGNADEKSPHLEDVVIGLIESVQNSKKWGIEYFVRWSDRQNDPAMNISERDITAMYELAQRVRRGEIN